MKILILLALLLNIVYSARRTKTRIFRDFAIFTCSVQCIAKMPFSVFTDSEYRNIWSDACKTSWEYLADFDQAVHEAVRTATKMVEERKNKNEHKKSRSRRYK